MITTEMPGKRNLHKNVKRSLIQKSNLIKRTVVSLLVNFYNLSKSLPTRHYSVSTPAKQRTCYRYTAEAS